MLRVNDIVDVDAGGVARILALDENHFTDLKAREITGANLVVHASAFANSAGGEVYVGVDETGTGRDWRGFDSVEGANGHVQALQDAFAGNNVATISFLRGVGVKGFVLHIILEKSREIIPTPSGEIYVRLSAQKLPVKLQSYLEVERLRLDKGLATYEDMPLKDARRERVTDSLTVTEFMIEAVPVSEAEPWLNSQHLLVDGSPTVAAVLLFDDEPQALLPKRSAIKVLRYQSSASEGHRDQMFGDPLTFEGPLTWQIDGAVAAVIEIVEAEAVQTAAGLQAVKYPPETLHEIITNAVLHRDYSIPTDVQVRIFDNRIEVESPGRLPGHVTIDNILDEQYARNGKIVRLINKFPNPPNKDVGEGLNTAFQKMHDLGLKEPEFRETGNSLIVSIRHERLASYEEQIIEYLLEHGEIKNLGARELTGEGSENTMKRVLEKMMKAEQIYRDPARKGRATTYLLTREYEAKRRRGGK